MGSSEHQLTVPQMHHVYDVNIMNSLVSGVWKGYTDQRGVNDTQGPKTERETDHLDHCNHCNHCSRSSYPSHSDYLILECLFFPWDEFELFVD